MLVYQQVIFIQNLNLIAGLNVFTAYLFRLLTNVQNPLFTLCLKTEKNRNRNSAYFFYFFKNVCFLCMIFKAF